MIKKILLSIIPISALALLSSSQMSDNGKAGRTGAPGENPCTNSCHNTYALNSGLGSISLQTPGMTNFEYTPGQTYNMSVTVSQSAIGLFGVGIEALKASDSSNAGTLNITDMASTQIKTATVLGKSRRNVVHTLNGGASTGSKVFNFSWTAPAQGTGDLTFYFAGVAANGSGSDSGDYVYNSSQLFHEACQTPTQPGSITGSAFLCEGSTSTYDVPLVSGATVYTWTLPSGWSGTSTTNSISVTTNATSGTISVTADNTCGNSTASNFSVTVNPNPVPVVTFTYDTLFSTSAGTYQWYMNGNLISGATSSYYVPNMNGTYSVSVTDASTTCPGTSADFLLTTIGILSPSNNKQLSLFPNPANDNVQINIPSEMRNSILKVYNVTGQVVIQTELTEIQNSVSLNGLPEGTYTLVDQKGEDRSISRLLISKN